MADELFWKLVKEYNNLMKTAIIGPNCIDPNVCKGDCCSIMINVPKVLAIEYIKRGFANKKDFLRTDVLSFKLRFDEDEGKCFLFSKSINGCSVHSSGIKPPQCWIYPTTFSNPQNKEINCKRAAGWKIVDKNKVRHAQEILNKYIFLCQLEAKKELKDLENRMGKGKGSTGNLNSLKKRIEKVAPSHLGGFKDTWDKIKILSSEGFSLQMKKFCERYNNNCNFLPDDFLECNNICDKVSIKLIEFLHNNLLSYIKEKGPDTDGDYSLFKLFNFIEI